jgi:hypothetical protein
MKLNNMEKIFLEAREKNYTRLLFNFNFGKILFKCLLLIENKVLMISNISCSIGHSITIDDGGNISSYVPNDFYNTIVDELKELYKDNKINLMWNEFDEYLLRLNIDIISEPRNKDILEIVRSLKTSDSKYDPDGDKPYFKTWIRNDINHCSKENNNKTARYFGENIANLCKIGNISSRWSSIMQNDSFCFLKLKDVEMELKN